MCTKLIVIGARCRRCVSMIRPSATRQGGPVSVAEILINIAIALVTGSLTGVVAGLYVDRKLRDREAARWEMPKQSMYALTLEAMGELLEQVLPVDLKGADPISSQIVYHYGDTVRTIATKPGSTIKELEAFAFDNCGVSTAGTRNFGATVREATLSRTEALINPVLGSALPTLEPEFIVKVRDCWLALSEARKMENVAEMAPELPAAEMDTLPVDKLGERNERHKEAQFLVERAYVDLARKALSVWEWVEPRATSRKTHQTALEELTTEVEQSKGRVEQLVSEKDELLSRVKPESSERTHGS